jgi:hypothetical protein
MAAHRYWRIFCQTNNGGGAFGIAECTMATSLGGSNVATGGTASASSQFATPTYTADKAFDTNNATFWNSATASSGEWLQYDLGAGNDKDVIQFTITARPDSFSTSQTPVTGLFQYSDNGTTWTTSFSFTGVTSPTTSQVQTFAAEPAATHWNPANKTAAFALDSTFLIATSSAIATAAATRSMTGLTYFEITATTLTGTLSIGFVNRSYNMASGTILGTDNNGLGFKSSGAVVLNNATLSTIQTYAQGDVVCVAVDIANRLVWFRTNGGNWNNSGAANPATGVGGIDYSSMSLGALLPAIGCSVTGAVLTGKFTSGFAQTAPSGFITVDTCAATARASWLGIGRNNRAFSPAGAIKSVSGQVQESGTPTVGKKVYLYDHSTGELLGTTTSDGSGNFSIPALGRAKTFGVALDDPTYNALVYDGVVPV